MPGRIAIRLLWMFLLVLVLVVLARSEVDFVYRGF